MPATASQARSPAGAPASPEPYDRRVARLLDPHAARVVGFLVTRVVVHWDTVGPHAAPTHANPRTCLQWRVHFADPGHGELFCDDVAELRPCAADELATGRFVVQGRSLAVQWLDGEPGDEAWRQLGW